MTAKPVKALPDKPSALIRLALRDLEKVERSRSYKVDMGSWHMPEVKWCRVCFAGSVMAMSLNAERARFLGPPDFPKEAHKLDALDRFRSGSVRYGLEDFGVAASRTRRVLRALAAREGRLDRGVTPYDVDPKLFKHDMRRLATLLAKHGL